ncbi:MAG: hypothetical protein J5I65_01540 [Aridibacter famidurans]|nr:hypothetical protein [Aridibacter famidurans]
MKLSKGDIVTVVLQNPREKILGVMEKISDAGLYIRGIDLAYFEEWAQAIRNDEQYLPMQDLFYPMWRVERISRDSESAGVPSMADQFEQRTGRSLTDF